MAKKRNDWIIIGISGVTCGGKTSLALNLMNKLYPAHLYHQDDYFYPDDSPKHVKCRNLDHNNYDTLSSLDMESLAKHTLATIKGERPGTKYQLEKKPGRYMIEGKKFLIIEGFTILNYPPLYALCDLKYYIVLSYEECISRRIMRLYDPPDIDGYFDQCVWPEHVRYRKMLENDSSVTMLDGTQANSLEIIMGDLTKLGLTKIPSIVMDL